MGIRFSLYFNGGAILKCKLKKLFISDGGNLCTTRLSLIVSQPIKVVVVVVLVVVGVFFLVVVLFCFFVLGRACTCT